MLKTTIFIVTLFLLATSCSTVRPAASRQPASAAATSTASSGSVQFIDNISVTPSGRQDKSHSSISAPATGSGKESNAYSNRPAGPIENYPALQFKYAILENATVEELNNSKLLSFMDYWYGAPYRYGGTSRDGIDCSAFSFLLLSSVYGVASLPRTSKEQYETSHRIRRGELQEGDLVFFHTLGKRRVVTHVGVYLRNNRFIHASVSGVMISDMNDGYYDKHFVGAGRVLDPGQVESSAKVGPVGGQ